MFPYDNALSQFIREMGDKTFLGLMNAMYSSDLIGLMMYVSTIVAFIVLSRYVAKDGGIRYFFVFLIASVLAFPVKNGKVNKPFGFLVTDVLTDEVANTIKSVLAQNSYKNGQMPPGYLATALSGAIAISKDMPLDLRKQGIALLSSCTPTGKKTYAGERITPFHLFRGEIGNEGYLTLEFPESYLRNRTYFLDGEEKNCLDGHRLFIKGLYSNAENYASKEYERFRGLYGGGALSERVGKTVKNTAATAMALGVADDLRETYSNKLNTDALSNFTSANNGFTGSYLQLKYRIKSMFSWAANETGVHGLSVIEEEMNNYREKMHDFPYYISYVYIILQFAFSIVIFIPFITGSFRFPKLWFSAFLALKVSGWLLVYMRTIMNNQLEVLAHIDSGASSLISQLDVSSLGELTEGTMRMLKNYLLLEKAMISTAMLGIPLMSSFISAKAERSKTLDSLKGGASGVSGTLKQGGVSAFKSGFMDTSAGAALNGARETVTSAGKAVGRGTVAGAGLMKSGATSALGPVGFAAGATMKVVGATVKQAGKFTKGRKNV